MNSLPRETESFAQAFSKACGSRAEPRRFQGRRPWRVPRAEPLGTKCAPQGVNRKTAQWAVFRDKLRTKSLIWLSQLYATLLLGTPCKIGRPLVAFCDWLARGIIPRVITMLFVCGRGPPVCHVLCGLMWASAPTVAISVGFCYNNGINQKEAVQKLKNFSNYPTF